MQKKRDILIFAAQVVVFSAVLAYLSREIFSNAMFVIAAASVVLAARGAEWLRRIAYSTALLGGYYVFDRAYELFGLTERTLQGFGSNPVSNMLGLVYVTVTFAYPVAILVLFVGKTPSMLWDSTANETAPPRGTKR